MTATDTESTPSISGLQVRLGKLSEALHRAYCMAVCLDRALRHNASDDSPELAVCLHEYVVLPLDALGFEAAQLKEALESETASSASRNESPADGEL